jgi:hypothetical protein
MIKFFYTTGDSFGFGQELGDEDGLRTLFIFTDHRRKYCYSGIMSDSFGTPEYMNTCFPGGSNERSYRMIVRDISEKLKIYKPEEMFVTVTLTAPARREFYRNSGDWYAHLASWEPIPGKEVDYTEFTLADHELWKILARSFNGDEGHYAFDTMMILGIQNFLRTNKIPYLLTSSLGNPRESEIRKGFVSEAITDQIIQVRDDLIANHPSGGIAE